MTTATLTKTKSDAQIRRTKKYAALLAVLNSPEEAIRSYREHVLGEYPEPEPEAVLAEAGFTSDEAEHIIDSGETPPSIESALDALLVRHGFDYAKGRVYVTPDVNEAIVRVMKNNAPEVVASTRGNKVRAVAIFKTDAGDVALQNLIRKDS